MRKIILAALATVLAYNTAFAASAEPIPNRVVVPEKYTQEYIDSLADEYKKCQTNRFFICCIRYDERLKWRFV